jgi:hypothetical protein
MEEIGCPETSVTNHKYTLRNIQEELISYFKFIYMIIIDLPTNNSDIFKLQRKHLHQLFRTLSLLKV